MDNLPALLSKLSLVDTIINKKSVEKLVDGPGIYAYAINGINANGGRIVKVGMSATSVIGRLKAEARDMSRWRTKCYPDMLFLKIGPNYVGYEKSQRESMGIPLTTLDLAQSASTIIKLSEISGIPMTKSGKLKVGDGWNPWLRADGKRVNVGPSEFVFVPESVYEALKSGQDNPHKVLPDTIKIDFSENSLGPLVFVNLK